MQKKLLETKTISFNGTNCEVKYFRQRDLDGDVIYSSEVTFREDDKMILDGSSLGNLQQKVNLVLPASIYSRVVAGILEVA